MGDFATEQFRKQQDVRIHYQPGGAGPRNSVYYLGSSDAQTGFVTGATLVNSGSVEPLWVPSPRRPGTWELKGRTRQTPALPTVSVEWMENIEGGIPRQLLKQNCAQTFYELSSRCKDLSDYNRGWGGYVMIYADGIAGPVNAGGRSNRTDDNPLTDSLDYTLRDAYPVGQLGFGEEAPGDVVMEVLDGVYYGAGNCSDCGIENDGSRLSYYVTRANVGSPAAPGQIVYSTDYGITWATALITGIGSTNAPVGIDVAGNRLFVWVPASTSIFYASINDETGVPGAFTAVTGTGAYNDAYVRSSRDIWFCGTNGIIHRTRDIGVAPSLVDNGAGAVALNRIHGSGNTIVAVGASGMVRASQNAGVTWTTYQVNVGGVISTAFVGVWVWSAKRWFVLGTNNTLYVTENGGLTWFAVALPTATAATDIVFATPNVGYITQQASSTAYLACTIDGGATWANDGARLLNFPTFEKANRIAVPNSGISDVDANTVGLAGLRATAGGDGIIQLGVSSKL